MLFVSKNQLYQIVTFLCGSKAGKASRQYFTEYFSSKQTVLTGIYKKNPKHLNADFQLTIPSPSPQYLHFLPMLSPSCTNPSVLQKTSQPTSDPEISAWKTTRKNAKPNKYRPQTKNCVQWGWGKKEEEVVYVQWGWHRETEGQALKMPFFPSFLQQHLPIRAAKQAQPKSCVAQGPVPDRIAQLLVSHWNCHKQNSTVRKD